MAPPKNTYYLVPRIAEGLGKLAERLYVDMCRKSSYTNDGYTGDLPINIPISFSQLIVTIGWMMKACDATRGRTIVARNRLIQRGALVKICDEGDLGNRYLLPHQAAVKSGIINKDEQQAFIMQIVAYQQAIHSQTTGGKPTPATAKAVPKTADQQADNSQATGKQQADNYKTKYTVQSTQYPVLTTDDDSVYTTLLEKEENCKIRENIIEYYLSFENTTYIWREADEQTMRYWFLRFEGYGFQLSDASQGISAAMVRVRFKQINSLEYFTEAVWEMVKKRRDDEINAGRK